ncbi:uncharacterized protein SEPMUDRAFT_152415 [Sphaerulina musiva SO2202]|uniref:AA1-like domain-containing protein n=1 Tax=Sphaerulina musiva (strain SO2202) TaxID=692275 RepID=M3ARM3_SPHMS|nr:uncharacterized protein SEPMUDRAFT_152415 [Sphaerulina musiva SO2202]EMF08144.1 hypothetical protein SEPMUDRAFT_152415 [Sphaerulina musiva SO2202]
MLSSKQLLASLAAFATSSQALYFNLDPFIASDVRVPSESHYISFTVSNPEAVFEQGGPYPRNCSISWTTSPPPTCWTPCQSDSLSPSYFTRVSPDTYPGDSASKFILEIEEYFVYKNSAKYNVTVAVEETPTTNTTGPLYRCSRGGQSTICGYWGQPMGWNTSELTATYSVAPRDGVCGEA